MRTAIITADAIKIAQFIKLIFSPTVIYKSWKENSKFLSWCFTHLEAWEGEDKETTEKTFREWQITEKTQCSVSISFFASIEYSPF